MKIVPLISVRQAVRERGYHSNMLTQVGHQLTVTNSRGASGNYPAGHYQVQENRHKWPREHCAVITLNERRFKFSDITESEIKEQTQRIIEEFRKLYPEHSMRGNRAGKTLEAMSEREGEFIKMLLNGKIVMKRPRGYDSALTKSSLMNIVKGYHLLCGIYISLAREYDSQAYENTTHGTPRLKLDFGADRVQLTNLNDGFHFATRISTVEAALQEEVNIEF